MHRIEERLLRCRSRAWRSICEPVCTAAAVDHHPFSYMRIRSPGILTYGVEEGHESQKGHFTYASRGLRGFLWVRNAGEKLNKLRWWLGQAGGWQTGKQGSPTASDSTVDLVDATHITLLHSSSSSSRKRERERERERGRACVLARR